MVSCSSATYGKSGKYQKKALVTNFRRVHSGQWHFSYLEGQCLDLCKKKENKALLSSSGGKKRGENRVKKIQSQVQARTNNALHLRKKTKLHSVSIVYGICFWQWHLYPLPALQWLDWVGLRVCAQISFITSKKNNLL